MNQFPNLLRSAAVVAAVLIVAQLASPSARSASSPLGIWLDHTGRGGVEISSCGKKLCGRIVWLADPNGSDGRPLTDGNNPRASNRKRTICGLPIIGGLKNSGTRFWSGGWIYDPETGDTYDVEITLLNERRLEVFGYAGIKFFGETLLWKRAPKSLGSC
ncbi:MAG: DUF2147 domain-containing protein [Hyphomicrobiaceae bacterium]